MHPYIPLKQVNPGLSFCVGSQTQEETGHRPMVLAAKKFKQKTKVGGAWNWGLGFIRFSGGFAQIVVSVKQLFKFKGIPDGNQLFWYIA